MTNKLCLVGTLCALLAPAGHSAHAGSWAQTSDTPIAADMGSAIATHPNLLAHSVGTTTTPTEMVSIGTHYYWQWQPNNGDIIADPAPQTTTITHSYALGGGPLTATADMGNAEASANATFTASLPGSTQSLSYSANANTDGATNQSTPLPTALHTQSASASPDTNGLVDIIIYLSANGVARATTYSPSSSASASVSGRIQTSGATIAP